MARYVIGIDLGTSNSALCYINLQASDPKSEVLPIRQRLSDTAEGELEELPSFLFLPPDRSDPVPGQYAREKLPELPGRIIHSAKSWLCHAGVNRTENILPWGAELEMQSEKMSPVEVSAEYLRQIRYAWDSLIGTRGEEHLFSKQIVVVTVPASFDEVSQQLTIQAAQKAGYPTTLRLLEEPQAAFYYYLETHRSEIAKFENTSQVLICDVGGGTSDFSYFEVTPEPNGEPDIVRVSVGDHLLLGGDNVDFTLARIIEARMVQEGQKLSSKQWAYLVHQCRVLKERVLGDETIEKDKVFFVSVPSEGGSLFAASLSGSISCAEIMSCVQDGFFPLCDALDRPARRHGGLMEWGLPYASDTAITKHLANFLHQRPVTAILCTGGTLAPKFLRDRLVEAITSWQGYAPVVLENPSYQLAVAHGAAYYAYLREKKQKSIRGGYAHTVYLEIAQRSAQEQPLLVAIFPQGTEEHSVMRVPNRKFELHTDIPVRFQLYYSNIRQGDKVGDVVEYNDDEFFALPQVETVIRFSKKARFKGGSHVEVELESELDELGMLKMYCLAIESSEIENRWKLSFNLRRAHEEQGEERTINFGVETKKLEQAIEWLEMLWGKKKAEVQINPKRLFRDLEELFGIERKAWTVELLRALWPALSAGITRKGKSLQHELSWLNLAGFVLRPGYGADLDSWRMHELWRVFELGLNFPKESAAQIQWWILWRRVAGGLSKEQQEAIWVKLKAQLYRKGGATAEMLRLAGSLERLDSKEKIGLGNFIVEHILDRRSSLKDDYVWALGRIASRVPLYGEASCVLSAEQVVSWFEKLKVLDWKDVTYRSLCSAFCQAYRITGDRGRDMNADAQKALFQKLQGTAVSSHELQYITDYVPLEVEDRTKLFGEELPVGIRLVEDSSLIGL